MLRSPSRGRHISFFILIGSPACIISVKLPFISECNTATRLYTRSWLRVFDSSSINHALYLHKFLLFCLRHWHSRQVVLCVLEVKMNIISTILVMRKIKQNYSNSEVEEIFVNLLSTCFWNPMGYRLVSVAVVAQQIY